MSKLFVQVERVEDLIGRADNYFNCDFCGKDSVDATAFAYAEMKKPITNADRIRAMTDAELANWIDNDVAFWGKWCPNDAPVDPETKDCLRNGGECSRCILDWLKEEADDE